MDIVSLQHVSEPEIHKEPLLVKSVLNYMFHLHQHREIPKPMDQISIEKFIIRCQEIITI